MQKNRRAYLIKGFVSIGVFLFCLNFILAAVAPPTVELSGDDLLQNGGADDAYDALIIADITTVQANPTSRYI